MYIYIYMYMYQNTSAINVSTINDDDTRVYHSAYETERDTLQVGLFS